MRLFSSLPLTLLSISLAGDASAVLLRGDAEAITTGGSWDTTGPEAPFDLDPASLGGVHASIRFWIDTDLLPPDGEPQELGAYYFTGGSDPEWLAMEIEINGVTRRMGAGERALTSYEGTGPGLFGDTMQVVADRLENGGYPENLYLNLEVDDFGLGGAIPSSLDLTSELHPIPSTYYLAHSYDDPLGGSALWLDFRLLSLSLHPVPEPSALALFGLAALSLLRRRRVTR